MTTIKIDGKPLVVFTFDELPSVNEEINKARKNKYVSAKSTLQWRVAGARLAGRFMEEMNGSGYLIQNVALVVVNIYRDKQGKYDVTNPYVKAIMDGFTDAAIWPDDDWANLPMVIFRWRHADDGEEEGQRFEVEVHELDGVIQNGVTQVLPQGRFTKEGERI